jgi:hypothetical protein
MLLDASTEEQATNHAHRRQRKLQTPWVRHCAPHGEGIHGNRAMLLDPDGTLADIAGILKACPSRFAR